MTSVLTVSSYWIVIHPCHTAKKKQTKKTKKQVNELVIDSMESSRQSQMYQNLSPVLCPFLHLFSQQSKYQVAKVDLSPGRTCSASPWGQNYPRQRDRPDNSRSCSRLMIRKVWRVYSSAQITQMWVSLVREYDSVCQRLMPDCRHPPGCGFRIWVGEGVEKTGFNLMESEEEETVVFGCSPLGRPKTQNFQKSIPNSYGSLGDGGGSLSETTLAHVCIVLTEDLMPRMKDTLNAPKKKFHCVFVRNKNNQKVFEREQR